MAEKKWVRDVKTVSTYPPPGLFTKADDLLRFVEAVQKAGLKAKPEVGVQFGAGRARPRSWRRRGPVTPGGRSARHAAFLEAGAYQVMIESEGITENVRAWRTDVAARIVNALGLERVMFEAADPEVNLFVDHSQIVQLECLRSGIWGPRASGAGS